MRFPGLPAPDPGQPSLFNSVRGFWRVLVGTLHTRLDLFTTELEEEAVRVAYLVVAAVVALTCLHGAFFFGMLWILAAVWDTPYKLWVIGGIFLVYAGVALAAVLYVVSLVKGRPRFLNQTLAELKRDVEGLQTAMKKKEDHS